MVSAGLRTLEPEQIYEVADGREAQAILQQYAVDVVVTDVMMPNMTGTELMEWAQTHAPDPMWIVLSGLDTFDAAVDALHVGAFDYLAKPPEVRRVQVAVRNALERLELSRERERLYGELARSHDELAEKVQQLEDLCHMLEDQAQVIQADLERAEIIQRALLPQVPPKLGRWCVQTLYQQGHNVGGDYFDVVPLDRQHLGIVIADAAGHGVAAAMLSVLFKYRFKMWNEETQTPLMPQQVLSSVNAALYGDMTAQGMFITAVYALLDRRSGRLRIASAGHPPAIVVRADGEVQSIERGGPALGLQADATYMEKSLALEEGDRFLMYTDGILDGGEDALTVESIGAQLRQDEPADALLGKLFDAATRAVEGERDDITMVLLERSDGQSRYKTEQMPGHEPATPTGSHVKILKGVEGRRKAFIAISGNGTWARSNAFFDAANELIRRYGNLTIDLGTCDYLDSTFLGTIHEIVANDGDKVRLQRVSPRVRALFEELDMRNVVGLISMLTDELPAEMTSIADVDVGDPEHSRRVLKAHEILASLSEENQQRFKGVVDSLREELGIT